MKQKKLSSIIFTLILCSFTFNIGFSQTILTTYVEFFEEAANLDLWDPNPNLHEDGTPIFDISQGDGVLNVGVNQAYFYDGLFFNFTANENIIFDITNAPYIAIDVKIEPGATYGDMEVDSVAFAISVWGKSEDESLQKEFESVTNCAPDDGEWHTIIFEIIPVCWLTWPCDYEENYTEIEAVLLESKWPNNYVYDMQMDNFRIGEAVLPFVPPVVVTSYEEDFDNPVNLDLWAPNNDIHDDGTPIFEATQGDGVMNIIVDQANFFDWQYYNFMEYENVIIDMTNAPYVAIDIKIEPGATYDGLEIDEVVLSVSPWGPNEDGELKRQFESNQKTIPADGEWHTVIYEITNCDPIEWVCEYDNNYDEIHGITFESFVYPNNYAFSMQVDNFKIGEIATPPVTTRAPTKELTTTVVPNPVTADLLIQAEEKIEMISIFDVQGRLMVSHNVDQLRSISIDFSSYTKGFYLVETRSAHQVSTTKILKQ